MVKYILTLGIIFFTRVLFAQTIINRDVRIEEMVKQISSDSLRIYINDMVNFGTRNTLSTQLNTKKGIGAAKFYVEQKFKQFATFSNNRLCVMQDTITLQADKRRIDTTVLLGNVVATLKGNDVNDDRIFIMSAHLDAMRSNVMDRVGDAPGANDDASGVAAMLECARIMSKQAYSATIIFVAFSGEEQGLLGSNFMAKKVKQQNLNIEALLNNDIVGSNNSNETNNINNNIIRVFSEGMPAYELEKNAKSIRQLGLENDSKSRQIARYVKEIGERYVDNILVKMIYRNDRYLRGGDHTSFVEQGFGAVRLTEMNENYTHQHQDVRMENGIKYGDLITYIDFEYLRKNTAINLSVLANLAYAPSMPENVKMDVKKLSNYTALNWDRPKVGNVKGYFVTMRETSNSTWEKKFFTTNTTLNLPYSKDNYFFGVQSVNDMGNESLVVVPK